MAVCVHLRSRVDPFPPLSCGTVGGVTGLVNGEHSQLTGLGRVSQARTLDDDSFRIIRPRPVYGLTGCVHSASHFAK